MPVRCGQGYSSARQPQRVYDTPPVRQQGLYDIPAAMLKGPIHQTQLEEFKAKGLYDIPSFFGKEKQSVYDIPPTSCIEALGSHDREATYDFPPPMRRFTDPLTNHKSEGLYDIPPTTVKPSLKLNSIHLGGGISSLKQSIYDVPPTVVNSELVSKKQCVYDIPSTHQQSAQKDIYDIPRGLQDFEQSASGVGSTIYDVPPQVSQDVKTVQDVTDGMNRLSFSSTGSTRSNMSTSSTTSKESSVSASPLPEKKLLLDLDSAFERLTQLQQNVDTSIKGLMAFVNPNWRSYEIMEKNLNEIHACVDKGKDEFERQQRELLEKENIVKQNKVQLEQHQLNQFQELEKEVTKPVENDLSNWKAPQQIPQKSSSLSSQDKQLLFFYTEQCETHFVTLLNAIDAFFSSISGGQPPRIFVAHSKFIILSAHKLVFIGDTLSRQAMAQDVRNKVLNYSNLLCELLKSIVMATKTAALQYPSIAAVQEMVDKVTELSYHSDQFKDLLQHLASL
ncbi:enhancer of filamentation 1-like isoform X2 [Rhincodon typus]|uniref:enhancer of filamentation 1-like isoform X2 n=1 Tax=Rhincodon typus TaxID=259920 RepID=UPI00202ED079|nr:enhancer of filamentation 1-like isoform X2 [Rhincodon typus]